jgi:hypothetical protein
MPDVPGIQDDGIFMDEAGHRGSMSSDNDPSFEVVGICHVCVHRTGVLTCKAFPQDQGGIPSVILKGDFIHTQPFPGDNGIQFVRGA